MRELEIREAIAQGKTVHWANVGYTVVIGKYCQLFVVFTDNGYCTNLELNSMCHCFMGSSK